MKIGKEAQNREIGKIGKKGRVKVRLGRGKWVRIGEKAQNREDRGRR